MIIIAGTIDLADPSQIDEAIEKAKPLQQATRDDEPGCQAYVFSKDPCVAGRIAVHELWDDEASLAAHFKHDNYLNMGGLLQGFGLAGADNNKFRCDHKEPVYDETMTPAGRFFYAVIAPCRFGITVAFEALVIPIHADRSSIRYLHVACPCDMSPIG